MVFEKVNNIYLAQLIKREKDSNKLKMKEETLQWMPQIYKGSKGTIINKDIPTRWIFRRNGQIPRNTQPTESKKQKY